MICVCEGTCALRSSYAYSIFVVEGSYDCALSCHIAVVESMAMDYAATTGSYGKLLTMYHPYIQLWSFGDIKAPLQDSWVHSILLIPGVYFGKHA